MSVVRIRPRRQVTIPKEVFEKLHLEVGDFVETKAEGGKIIMIPKKLAPKGEVVPLTEEEQKMLLRAKEKIESIQRDILRSQGLSQEEIEVAVKVGLIPRDQAWWWTEEWQKGERAAEREIREGKVRGPFENIEEFKSWLKSRK